MRRKKGNTPLSKAEVSLLLKAANLTALFGYDQDAEPEDQLAQAKRSLSEITTILVVCNSGKITSESERATVLSVLSGRCEALQRMGHIRPTVIQSYEELKNRILYGDPKEHP